MLIAYLNSETLEAHEITDKNQALLKEAVWIDLFSPTKNEEALVEQFLHLNLPTRKKMKEIETSSRLYKEKQNLFMTAIMIANSTALHPKLDPVSFVLTPQQLITLRYINPQPFKSFTPQGNAQTLLIGLLDNAINRLADILELVGHRLDDYSKHIFRSEEEVTSKLDYRKLMQEVGADGDLNSKARESLITFNRLVTFLGQMADSRLDNKEQLRLTALGKDIASLSDHAHFMSTKISFLLDATLGMVTIEQNNIIKIFSVAAVIFLPPTLVASIYGMNFWYIPELTWKYGYLFSIGLIALAAWLPYKYFKHRKWL